MLWDACVVRVQELQSSLGQQNKAIEAARHEYEAARAAFYASPTDEGLKRGMLGIDAVLGKLRAERGDTESSLAKVKATMDELQVRETADFKTPYDCLPYVINLVKVVDDNPFYGVTVLVDTEAKMMTAWCSYAFFALYVSPHHSPPSSALMLLLPGQGACP